MSTTGKTVIEIEMSDGAKFEVSAYLVAFNRAVYFANSDLDTKTPQYDNPVWCDIFAEEFYNGLRDIKELREWIVYNMDWHELHAKMVRNPTEKPDYTKMLQEANFKTKVLST